MEQATGVFFTGGDQLRIPPNMAGTPFGTRMMERHRDGLLVAGTSAGAAAVSGTMIVRGRGDTVKRAGVEMVPGLGFWPEVVVDTHFDLSGRVHRLLAVLAQNPGILGLGIDEDTAVEVDDEKRFTVLGRGVVIVLDGRVTFTNAGKAGAEDPLALFDVRVQVLPAGYGLDLQSRRPIPPEGA